MRHSLPTLKQIETDKERRSIVREDSRRAALNSGDMHRRDAVIMAKNGYGVEDIARRTGVSMYEAKKIVLGLD